LFYFNLEFLFIAKIIAQGHSKMRVRDSSYFTQEYKMYMYIAVNKQKVHVENVTDAVLEGIYLS